MNKEEIESIGTKIVDAAYHVHKELGPGLLESVYEYCMLHELMSRNLIVRNQVRMPIIYKGIELNKNFVIDILVEKKVVVELKVVENFAEEHIAQTLTYLRLSGCKVGLLLNFYKKSLKDGIKRLIL